MIGGVQAKHDYLYWEYPASGGLQAIRMGKWKGIKIIYLKVLQN